MKRLVLPALVFFMATAAFAQDTLVFHDPLGVFTFRYPHGWEEVPPQRQATRVLLYARDGSEATCNVPVVRADRSKVDDYNRVYFESTLPRLFQGVEVRSATVRRLGLNRVAVVYYDWDLFLLEQVIRARTVAMFALHMGERYSVICNAPIGKFVSAHEAFKVIGPTFIFSVM